MTQRPGPFTAVADHVYVSLVPFAAEDGPAEVTVGLVVGSEGAVLVDCGVHAPSRAAGCGPRSPR